MNASDITAESLTQLPICRIGAIVRAHWPKPYFAAVPYLSALSDLYDMDSKCGHDSARDIVLRFLGNAQTWRGPIAKLVKAELKSRLAK